MDVRLQRNCNVLPSTKITYPHFSGGHELSQIVTAVDSNWLRMQLNGTKLPRTVRAISMVINV